jgi:hypothetical protein
MYTELVVISMMQEQLSAQGATRLGYAPAYVFQDWDHHILDCQLGIPGKPAYYFVEPACLLS